MNDKIQRLTFYLAIKTYEELKNGKKDCYCSGRQRSGQKSEKSRCRLSRRRPAPSQNLIEDGHEVVIAHGNGPQVGMIQNAFAAYHKQQAKSDIMPLSMCVAMSQGLHRLRSAEHDRRGA